MIKQLAIDQGSKKCGYAYLVDGEVKQSGVYNLKGETRIERYAMLLTELSDLVADEDIRHMAIEDVYLKRGKFNNPKTLKIMGETRGVLIAIGIMFNMEVTDVNPSELTSFLGINTRTQNKKRETQFYVSNLIGRAVKEDEADAVVIGLIAYQGLRHGKN